jgi:hypothetical protein
MDFRDLNQNQEVNTVYEQLVKVLNTHGRDSDEYARIYAIYNQLLTKDAKYFNDTYARRQDPTQFQFDIAYNLSHQMFDAYKQFQVSQPALDDLSRQFKQATGDRARDIVDQMYSLRGNYAAIGQDFHAYNDTEEGLGTSFDQAYDSTLPSIYDMAQGLETEAQLHKRTFNKE